MSALQRVGRRHCRGDCDIDLAWTGRGDLPLSAALSLASLGLLWFLS